MADIIDKLKTIMDTSANMKCKHCKLGVTAEDQWVIPSTGYHAHCLRCSVCGQGKTDKGEYVIAATRRHYKCN